MKHRKVTTFQNGVFAVFTLLLVSSTSVIAMPLTAEQQQRMVQEISEELNANVKQLFLKSKSTIGAGAPSSTGRSGSENGNDPER